MVTRLLKVLYKPKDPAGLGIARFCFGLLMIIDIFDERGLTYLLDKWGDPESCYFPLFEFLPRLSIEYFHIVYLILLVSSSGIMLGFFYRLSCFSFVISYWYIFLMDKTVWNNHSYLYGLMGFLFLLTDAHYYCSIDGLLWPSIRNKKIPLWNYTLFRFQVFILYFFAGLKKLDQDWVLGYSMGGLSKQWMFDPFRLFLTNEQIDLLVVHTGGLIFDLTQGFMLCFKKTRVIAFAFGYMFHGMNAVMFSIGMFSYTCMAMMPIFCTTDWPKTIIKQLPSMAQLFLPATVLSQDNQNCYFEVEKTKKEESSKKVGKGWRLTFFQRFLFFVVMSYVAIQVILPWSHSLTKGYNSWTNGLYGYSWDMMVHSWNTQHVVVKVVDKETNKIQYLRPGAFFPMSSERNRIFSHPDMMKQYAVCLAERVKRMDDLNLQHPQVYFDVWKSLNDRYQQRMLDPRVDLVTAKWSPFEESVWLRPLLVELTPWRETLTRIRSVNTKFNNAADIVFVADFPGLFLENYIAPEIEANITVLSGEIVVSFSNENITLKVNETYNLPSDETHLIYTVTDNPSCYMYVYLNTTWSGQTEDELIESDPELQQRINARKKWEKKSTQEKLFTFLKKKYKNYQQGLWQLYLAVSIILDIGHGEDGGTNVYDEL